MGKSLNSTAHAEREEQCPMCLGTVRAKLTITSWPRIEWFVRQQGLAIGGVVIGALAMVFAFLAWRQAIAITERYAADQNHQELMLRMEKEKQHGDSALPGALDVSEDR